MCTKNYHQMMYGSWDMMRDRCNCYFSFWAIFRTFTVLTVQKIKISKKWIKLLEISPFYICVPKIMIRWYTVPEIWCVTDVTIFHFGSFFALLLPQKPEKSKFWKNEKNIWRYHHFMYVHQKLSDDVRFLRCGAWQM